MTDNCHLVIDFFQTGVIMKSEVHRLGKLEKRCGNGVYSMLVDERRGRLLELVRERGFASPPELAGELAVSESTIRRDLDYLEQNGDAKRTHGGVLYTGPSPQLPHFEQRQSMHWDLKRQIAAAAAGLIEDGDTVVLDGGSTTYELAQLLVRRSLQVVTNSLPVANLFTASNSSELTMIGGSVNTRAGVSLGPYANQMLAELRARTTVLSVAGINQQGCYNSNLLLVETERAMMHAADNVIVLADSTKFDKQSLALLCELKDIDILVTDSHITPQWRTRVTETGTRLVIAEGTNQSA